MVRTRFLCAPRSNAQKTPPPGSAEVGAWGPDGSWPTGAYPTMIWATVGPFSRSTVSTASVR